MNKPLNHLCNCTFCTQKTGCLICGTHEKLHRAHIIPRHVISYLIEESKEKDQLLSFDGNNVFILCGKHHREFDAYKLWEDDKNKIREYVLDRIESFVNFVTDKSMRSNGLNVLKKWALKNNNFFFGGGQVISFTHEPID